MSEAEPADSGRTYPSNPHLWEINWVRDLVVFAILFSILLIVQYLRVIFEPVLMAILFAYLLNPFIDWSRLKLGWSRFGVLVGLYIVVALLLISASLTLIPIAVEQGRELTGKLPAYVNMWMDRFGGGNENVRQQVREKAAELIQDPVSTLDYLWNGVSTSVGVLTGLVGKTTGIVMGIALFPVYLFWFSWKWPTIAAWPLPFVPAKHRVRVRTIAQKMDQAVGGYFRTRLMIGFIMGVLYAAGWGLVGVPYWLLLGILAGVLGIIPYAASLVWILAVVMRFLDFDQGLTSTGDVLAVFVWPTLVFGAVQASDDWLWTPWLQGRQMEMDFVTIILAVLIGGSLFGLLGMLLAVPATACLRILWVDVLRPRAVSLAESPPSC